MNHGKRWTDDGMVGVDCYVNTVQRPHPTDGRMLTHPTDGGVLTDDGTECESCGAKLRLHWDVRIIEEAPRDPN